MNCWVERQTFFFHREKMCFSSPPQMGLFEAFKKAFFWVQGRRRRRSRRSRRRRRCSLHFSRANRVYKWNLPTKTILGLKGTSFSVTFLSLPFHARNNPFYHDHRLLLLLTVISQICFSQKSNLEPLIVRPRTRSLPTGLFKLDLCNIFWGGQKRL